MGVAGTGGHPESGTLSKVLSQDLVCWSTAISKSSFTKNQGEPPLNVVFFEQYVKYDDFIAL